MSIEDMEEIASGISSMGLFVREQVIEWIMAAETRIIQKIQNTSYIIIGLLAVIAILGIAILWNQRKIKKMLREMQEQKDKPQ